MKNKKKLNLLIQLIFVGLLLLTKTSCDKKEYTLPELSTTEVTDISQITATSGGTIASDGGAEVIVRGVCYSTSPGPTIDDGVTNDGLGAGTYTSPITNLTFGTTYYVRAYAFNIEKGVAYGNEVSFRTLDPAGADCLADIWTGDLNCKDTYFEGYDPTYCTGVKMGDCNLLNVTFDFWGYGTGAEVVFELQFEPFDPATYTGELNLVKEANYYGYIFFHEGAAGTYDILKKTLYLDVTWSGYYAEPSQYTFEITLK